MYIKNEEHMFKHTFEDFLANTNSSVLKYIDAN